MTERVPGTGPFGRYEGGKNIRNIVGRVHIHEKSQLISRLKTVNITASDFVKAMVQAFITGHPAVQLVLDDWKRRNKIEKQQASSFTFAKSERDEIEAELHSGNAFSAEEDRED